MGASKVQGEVSDSANLQLSHTEILPIALEIVFSVLGIWKYLHSTPNLAYKSFSILWALLTKSKKWRFGASRFCTENSLLVDYHPRYITTLLNSMQWWAIPPKQGMQFKAGSTLNNVVRVSCSAHGPIPDNGFQVGIENNKSDCTHRIGKAPIKLTYQT